ncbi:hypothetical protein [Streptomyces sp. Je 1-369]|uniref:hypothetical protein n=1 Tax=Streptomyces sp. Je 1-369 TaxID=2966192 RepID=UPI0022859352|nr:hypothetical protein [Streptomyces sp. Je 1-369]WAL99769.1 hypothetical protein NOO62_38050 [Streptomyces sp. Je 1-369]
MITTSALDGTARWVDVDVDVDVDADAVAGGEGAKRPLPSGRGPGLSWHDMARYCMARRGREPLYSTCTAACSPMVQHAARRRP